MRIFNFKTYENKILLENGFLKDITDLKQTELMPKYLFVKNKYKISENMFMTKSDVIIKKATNVKKKHWLLLL